MKSPAVEMRYSVAEVALLARLHAKTVIAKLKAGEFGPAWNIGSEQRPDYRISASGFNAWWDRHALFFGWRAGC